MPQCLIRDLYIGQRVDLEGDLYADANNTGTHYGEGASEHPEWQFEFETVAMIEHETPGCTLVVFQSGYACGFPPDHSVDVDGEQVKP